MYRQICHSRNLLGVTLVEMLVAMAVTLVMMASVVALFDRIGRGVHLSRATIEMANRLRSARERLASDLAGHTCTTRPWAQDSSGEGYFEYAEGPANDAYPTALALDPATGLIPTNARGNYDSMQGPSGLGDHDDILIFTARSGGEPFVGRFGAETIEAPVAEIVWFAVENPDVPPGSPAYRGEPGLRTIYRRVLLVVPWVSLPHMPLDRFYHDYDVSVRMEDGRLVPNSLSDLARRENRYAHLAGPGSFPHPIATAPPAPIYLVPFNQASGRQGEDVVLTNVLAFDMRAYDPGAPLFDVSGVTLAPGDAAYNAGVINPTTPPAAYGAYVDLNYFLPVYLSSAGMVEPPKLFNGFQGITDWNERWLWNGSDPLAGDDPLKAVWRAKCGLRAPTYDTWPFHYEHDGNNQENGSFAATGAADEGTNGFDDDGRHGVDDVGERETSPPYPVALRGIEVKIRVYEPDSRQVREVSVKKTFVPE